MNDAAHDTRPPCIVIHENPVVAEDLRELLVEEGASDVLVTARLADAVGYAASVVVIGRAYREPGAGRALAQWRALGIPVVVVGGHAAGEATPDGVYAIEQPFSSETVIAVLRTLAVP